MSWHIEPATFRETAKLIITTTDGKLEIPAKSYNIKQWYESDFRTAVQPDKEAGK